METNQLLHKSHSCPVMTNCYLKSQVLPSLTFALKRHCHQHIFYVSAHTKLDQNPHWSKSQDLRRQRTMLVLTSFNNKEQFSIVPSHDLKWEKSLKDISANISVKATFSYSPCWALDITFFQAGITRKRMVSTRIIKHFMHNCF